MNIEFGQYKKQVRNINVTTEFSVNIRVTKLFQHKEKRGQNNFLYFVGQKEFLWSKLDFVPADIFHRAGPVWSKRG